MKENDGELEKVNQLLGKVHKEAEAGKRRVLLTEEREELLPQLERDQGRGRKSGKGTWADSEVNAFHTEGKRESGTGI